MDYNGHKYICFSDESTLQYLGKNSSIAGVVLEDRFPPSDEPYFPFDGWIIGLSCIGLVICIFDSDGLLHNFGLYDIIFRSRRNTPIHIADKIAIRRLHFAVGTAVGIGLLFSAQRFNQMRRERCRQE